MAIPSIMVAEGGWISFAADVFFSSSLASAALFSSVFHQGLPTPMVLCVGAVSRFHHRNGFLSTHLQTRDEDTLTLRVCVCRLLRRRPVVRCVAVSLTVTSIPRLPRYLNRSLSRYLALGSTKQNEKKPFSFKLTLHYCCTYSRSSSK